MERSTVVETTQNRLNNLVQGLEHKLGLRQNYFLGNNVNCGQQQPQQQQQKCFICKKQYVDVRRAGKKDAFQRKLNRKISSQIFPTIV